MKTFKLYNGVEIPAIGIGPAGMPAVKGFAGRDIFSRVLRKFYAAPKVHRDYVSSVAAAIKSGYRLIDFAAIYGNGGYIADAIDMSGVSRKDVFLTGRISNKAQFAGPQAVESQIRMILDQYRTDYVDLLMFHWPVPECYEKTWEVICNAYEKGVARSIGVANCNRPHLERLMTCGLKPMVNQFEVHPLFTQKQLVSYCQGLSIQVEAYTAIARFDSRLMGRPALKLIAQAHSKAPVQVVLRWHIQNGVLPVIRSLNPECQRQNIDIFDFELSKEEIAVIDGLNINSRLRHDPDNCDFTVL